MLLVFTEYDGAIEEQLFAFGESDSMALPNLFGISSVPLKTLASLDESLQPSHRTLLYMAATYDDKPGVRHRPGRSELGRGRRQYPGFPFDMAQGQAIGFRAGGRLSCFALADDGKSSPANDRERA